MEGLVFGRALVEFSKEGNDGAEEARNKIGKNIMETAAEALGIIKINMHNQKHDKPWFFPEIKGMAKEKKATYIKYLNNRMEEELRRLNELRNRVIS